VGAIAIAFAVVDTARRMHRMLLADAEPIPHANTLRVAITIAEPDIDAARQHGI
jgi:hypothetical protein